MTDRKCAATSNKTWVRCSKNSTSLISFDASPRETYAYCDEHKKVVLAAFNAFVVDDKRKAA